MGLAASTFWREDFSDNERASPIRVETRVGRPDRGILQAAHGKHGYIGYFIKGQRLCLVETRGLRLYGQALTSMVRGRCRML